MILDLHFDACDFQRDKSPGLLREGPIGVTSGDGSLAYRGPDAEEVPDSWPSSSTGSRAGDLDAPAVVRAAMAHLNLVFIHPFRDGNGRISRIVQSLVLAREGLISPEFSSIEEYLGRTRPPTMRPSKPSATTTSRSWTPPAGSPSASRRTSCRPGSGLRRSSRQARVGVSSSGSSRDAGWSDRLVIALEQSLFHGADRSSYATEAGVSPATASADLRRLLDAGLVVQQNLGRMTRYTASDALRSDVRDALGERADETETWH